MNGTKEERAPSVQSWHVESFFPPPCQDGSVTISVSHDGIVVSGAECSVIGSDISLVVVDEEYLGCILQSRGFHSWRDVSDFVSTLPSHRIVAIQGSSTREAEGEADAKNGLSRLGGFSIPDGTKRISYLGQVDANPAWSQRRCVSDGESPIHVQFPSAKLKTALKLRTERDTVPHRISWWLPESVMPLQTQLMASEEQQRMAFLRFCENR